MKHGEEWLGQKVHVRPDQKDDLLWFTATYPYDGHLSAVDISPSHAVEVTFDEARNLPFRLHGFTES